MSETVFQMIEGVPAIVFRPAGGVMTWQEWMCQPVAVLVESPDKPDRAVLISFQSGIALASMPIPSEHLEAWKKSGLHFLTCGDLPESQRSDAAIIKREPFEFSGHLCEGIKKQMRGELEAAIKAYRQAEEEIPALPRAANLRGLCLKLLGRHEEAEAAYRRELDVSPAMPDAFANLGILYARTGRAAEARTMFEKALDRDQFYLNALLHLARLLAADEQRNSRLFSSLNMRLLAAWADLPQVQEHLLTMSAACDTRPAEFAAKLRAESGWLADPLLLQTMKRCEILRLNGAYLATLRGYALLLDRSAGLPIAPFFQNWTMRRCTLIERMLDGACRKAWDSLIGEIRGRHPGWPPTIAREARHESGQGVRGESGEALTIEEFYAIVLAEIIRDGQISNRETVLMGRLRTALGISEERHSSMLERAVSTAVRSPMTDGSGEFNGERLLRCLAAAILRDGRIDEREKKFVILAAQALEVSADAVKTAFREVTR
ncbi:MAG TPA: tetratricopeptide repeat protein [Candidatus Ozemobacteraceae bacterium]|nr:tetratricopeptide repeat protein [Candidatus Ozemobacteraceae bacterium]